MQDSVPHFLRFTRALAVGSALTFVAGCGSAATASDVPTGTDATASWDTGGNTCATCRCSFGGPVAQDVPTDPSVPACEAIGLAVCCAAVGPLPPPELA